MSLTHPYSASIFNSDENMYEEFVTEDTIVLNYGIALIEYEKQKINNYISFRKHINVNTGAPAYHINPNFPDFKLKIILNYTASMNYTAGFPFIVLAPLVAFGFKVNNHTDYDWDSFKLKHSGQSMKKGNISLEIDINLSGFKSGDEIILDPQVVVIGDPEVYTSNEFPREYKNTSLLLRCAFNLPIIGDCLLLNHILPFYAEWNTFGSIDIILKFD
jgi:hypothetical protein